MSVSQFGARYSMSESENSAYLVGQSSYHAASHSGWRRPSGASCSSSQPLLSKRRNIGSDESVDPQSPTTSRNSVPAKGRIDRIQSSVAWAVLKFAVYTVTPDRVTPTFDARGRE